MPRRRLAGRPTTSRAPYREPLDGTRRIETLTVRREPAGMVKRDTLTRTPPSDPRRRAATEPLLDCRHGRVRTVTRSRRPEELLIVTARDAPRRAVVSRIEGVTESPPPA